MLSRLQPTRSAIHGSSSFRIPIRGSKEWECTPTTQRRCFGKNRRNKGSYEVGVLKKIHLGARCDTKEMKYEARNMYVVTEYLYRLILSIYNGI